MNLVYGTDPEFFACYPKNGGLFALPPYFFRKYLGVKTSKDPRHPVFWRPHNGAIVHEDGAAFEMSVPPSQNWEELFEVVNWTRKEFSKKFLEGVEDCLPELMVRPTVGWEVERWKNEAEDFFMSTQFGCDPDFDAFDYEPVAHVMDASKHEFRYGGGHIHFSGIPGVEERPLPLVHSLAFTAGLACVAFSVTPEEDKQRTFLYGKPGKFRVQRYKKQWNNLPDTHIGIEYRTPSNAWTGDRSLAGKVFEWARIGIENLFVKKALNKVYADLNDDVQKAIVNCDQELATELLGYVNQII